MKSNSLFDGMVLEYARVWLVLMMLLAQLAAVAIVKILWTWAFPAKP